MSNKRRIDYRKVEYIPKSAIHYMPTIPNPIYKIEWKLIDIDGIRKNYYWASTTGLVVNIHQRILHSRMINTGYYAYTLLSDNDEVKYKHILAHRLFMMVFNPIDNPGLYTVNHKNLDRSNNYLYNLEWMTQAENNYHKEYTANCSGINSYQALFNYSQLRVIVQELQKGTSYTNILLMIGLEPTDNNRDYIGNIKRGRTYKKEVEEILNG